MQCWDEGVTINIFIIFQGKDHPPLAVWLARDRVAFVRHVVVGIWCSGGAGGTLYAGNPPIPNKDTHKTLPQPRESAEIAVAFPRCERNISQY